jgi:hypothetical protein
MAVHDFNFSVDERILSIDDVPDNRSDVEKQFSPLSVFNHLKPDLGYAERLAEEAINISGAWLMIFARTDNEDFNKTYEEDPNPTYKNGVRLKGYFKPEPLQLQLTKWGVDAPNTTTVVFARSAILDAFGQKRMIRPGDMLEIPHNSTGLVRSRRFRVVDAQDTGNFQYRWLYFSALVENIPDDKALAIDHR